MKKTLLATTLLVATAGFAAAEVTISGSGRFGIQSEDGDSWVHHRLRFNIDAKMETDGGITFGGRIRLQDQTGWGGAYANQAMLYMEANGLRVEVGNANGAYDSAGLLWNSEIGLVDSSLGDPNAWYNGYYHSGSPESDDAVGIFASYTSGSLTARVSYHDMDQDPASNNDTETSASIDWSSNGFSVSAAVLSSDWWGDASFIGAAYAIGDATNVGLNLMDSDMWGGQTTLYANHSMGNGVTVAGYITDWEFASDNAYGIGASYDLGGGAAIKGSYQTGGSYDYADFGVSFSF